MPSAPTSAINSEVADPVRFSFIAGALIPHDHRKKDAHATPVKIRDHLLHAGHSSRHRPQHVILVSIIDADVRINCQISTASIPP